MILRCVAARHPGTVPKRMTAEAFILQIIFVSAWEGCKSRLHPYLPMCTDGVGEPDKVLNIVHGPDSETRTAMGKEAEKLSGSNRARSEVMRCHTIPRRGKLVPYHTSLRGLLEEIRKLVGDLHRGAW